VLGWRAWRVAETRLGLRLCSVIYDEVWEPGRALQATCHGGGAPHAAPAATCSCGIHALRGRAEAARYLVGRNDPLIVDRVLGLVALWGVVFEGERGWRGRFAYPERLWVARSDVARSLRAYGVAVETGGRGRRDTINPCASWSVSSTSTAP
jgi:hypothetical protein